MVNRHPRPNKSDEHTTSLGESQFGTPWAVGSAEAPKSPQAETRIKHGESDRRTKEADPAQPTSPTARSLDQGNARLLPKLLP